MKKLFILFFILIQTFCISANADTAVVYDSFNNTDSQIVQNHRQNNKNSILGVDFKTNENAVLSLRNSIEEISSYNKKSGSEGKINTTSLLYDFQVTLSRHKKKFIIAKSHNISSYLNNEICTRAP